jgi:spermidine synthase
VLVPAAGVAAAVALVVVFFIPAAKPTFIQRKVAATGVPTAHYEDSVASVDVTGGKPLNRNLYINGEGITKLTVITKVLADLPKAARPSATTMLNICFGMGTTYRSSIILGLRTTAVELDPTVPSVMNWFYPDASKYLHSPLGHIIVSDGRNYVRLSDKRYDLITVDLPPPIWSAGAVVLLTQEFFQEAAQRLTPGGVMTTYIPLQEKRLEQMILRTFRSAFPHMTVVYDPRHTGAYLMGSKAPIVLGPAAIRSIFGRPAVRADLRGAPDYPARTTAQWVSIIRGSVWLTDNQVNAYTGPGPMITDDHPVIEYFMLDGFGSATGRTRVLVHRLALVVSILLGLLVIAAAVDSALRRRRRVAMPPGEEPTARPSDATANPV